MNPANRIAQATPRRPVAKHAARPASGIPTGFVACPMPWIAVMSPAQVQWQQEIYRRAYEQARAAIQPAFYRRLFSCMN